MYGGTGTQFDPDVSQFLHYISGVDVTGVSGVIGEVGVGVIPAVSVV